MSSVKCWAARTIATLRCAPLRCARARVCVCVCIMEKKRDETYRSERSRVAQTRFRNVTRHKSDDRRVGGVTIGTIVHLAASCTAPRSGVAVFFWGTSVKESRTTLSLLPQQHSSPFAFSRKHPSHFPHTYTHCRERERERERESRAYDKDAWPLSIQSFSMHTFVYVTVFVLASKTPKARSSPRSLATPACWTRNDHGTVPLCSCADR